MSSSFSCSTYSSQGLSSYASHNDYIGFKKMVHDAHYPEDSAPPMPHASTWFAVEADDGPSPETRSAAAAANASADDDLAVASERISIKCPITLLDMKDPVTSQKCPHSFEKAAILDMIRMSEDTLPGTRQKAIQCPVCTVVCCSISYAIPSCPPPWPNKHS